MPEASIRTKLLAASGLVAVSTTVGVLYKVSQAASGGFTYSTTSAVALAEMAKLAMSMSFHLGDTPQEERSRPQAALAAALAQLTPASVGHISLLAVLYSLNNQISFYVYMLVDPGTVYLFKAGSTLIVALMQCGCAGKTFVPDQWKAMLLQAVGMIVVQYNPCRGTARYEPLAYALMAISTCISAVCAARNEYLIKHYAIGLHVQNIVLYTAGVCANVFAFACLPNPNSAQAHLGFFDGYDKPLACAVVFSNAIIGLAINAVYKYADAVTKCIAGDVTAVLLCVISSIFFELQPSITMWCGIFVVCYAVHDFISAGSATTPAPNSVTQARDLSVETPPSSKNEERLDKEKGDLCRRAFDLEPRDSLEMNDQDMRILELRSLVGKVTLDGTAPASDILPVEPTSAGRKRSPGQPYG